MRLTFPWASSASKALDTALARASDRPMPPMLGDRIRLEGPLPPDFKRQTMPRATAFRIDVSEHGHVFGLSEVDEHSSGGFGGSCIPVAGLISMLNLWAAQQTTQPVPRTPTVPVQGELF